MPSLFSSQASFGPRARIFSGMENRIPSHDLLAVRCMPAMPLCLFQDGCFSSPFRDKGKRPPPERSCRAGREKPGGFWFAGRKVLWGIPVPSPNGVEEGIVVGKHGISLPIKADPVIGRGRHALFFRGMPKRAP